jgi:hypothetical protein
VSVIAPSPTLADLKRLAPAIVRAGDAAMRGRGAGRWPYQWLYPGPNSRHVLARGSAATPAFNSGGVAVVTYQVPEGYRFSLRAVVVDGSQVSNWVPGSGDMTFDLNVISAGARTVDFLQNVLTPLGSAVIPWPILGRLEFESGEQLQWLVSTAQNVGVGAPNFVSCFLLGHTYPDSETDDL